MANSLLSLRQPGACSILFCLLVASEECCPGSPGEPAWSLPFAPFADLYREQASITLTSRARMHKSKKELRDVRWA